MGNHTGARDDERGSELGDFQLRTQLSIEGALP